MTFDEYKNRKWIITANGSEAKCKEGDIIIFDGLIEKVNIRCASKKYGDGQFKSPQEDEQEGTIEVDGYVIRMTGTKDQRQITFEKKDQQAFAGSWTAEDYVPPRSKPEPAGE
jgi:hypothetical protein